MAPEIIEDHDVAGLERWDQELFDISEKADAVDRPVEDGWRIDPVMPQRGQEGERLPVTVRNLGAQPFAPPTTTVGPGHVRLGPGFIDEDETARVKPTLMAFPACPPTRDIAPILLAGKNAFFEADTLADEDMSLSLSFSILGRHRAERIEGRSRLASDLSASTPLRWQLGRKFRSPVPSVWDDDEDSKLETKLAVIAADIIVAGEAAFRQNLIEAVEREEQWRKWQEERRQQRIAELEAQRLKDLKTSGMLLAQAEEIRALVTRVKSAVVVGATDILAEDLERWERWALDYADRLDPTLSGQVLSHIHVPELD